jgi:SAM-dependent methyltransferase
MILSVGCGKRGADPNVIRLDISPEVEPDMVWNLDDFPYPFAESLFAVIECLDVIEHLADIPKAMEEFHRILRPNGILKIATPHFSSANSFIDPTHRWHLSRFSFDYFGEAHDLAYYSNARYREKSGHIQFRLSAGLPIDFRKPTSSDSHGCFQPGFFTLSWKPSNKRPYAGESCPRCPNLFR